MYGQKENSRSRPWTKEDVSALKAHSKSKTRIRYSRRSPAQLTAVRTEDRNEAPGSGPQALPASAQLLAARNDEYNLAIVAADGLSSTAVQRHVAPLLERPLAALSETWRIAPIVIAEQARVRLGDAICSLLGAASVLVLIGERPGLSAMDSLSAYIPGSPSVA